MKYTIFLLLCLAQQAFSQEKIAFEDPAFDAYFVDPNHVPHVTGQITGMDAVELEKYVVEWCAPFPNGYNGKYEHKGMAKLQKDGSFVIDLPYAFPYQQIAIDVNDHFFVWIMVHQGVHVALNWNILKNTSLDSRGEGVVFTGADAQLCEVENRFGLYGAQHKIFFEKYLPRTADNSVYLGKETRSLLTTAFDSVRRAYQPFFQSISPEYHWILEEQLANLYYGELLHCLSEERDTIHTDLLQEINARKTYVLCFELYRMLHYLHSYSDSPTKAERQQILADMPVRKRDLYQLSTIHGSAEYKAAALTRMEPSLQTPWAKLLVQRELGILRKE